MAERGGEDEDENPFSFKSFVSSKGKKTFQQLDDGCDEDDIFRTDDKKEAKKTLRSSNVTSTSFLDSTSSLPVTGLAAGGSPTSGRRKDKQKENPFSFKKFLSGSSASSDKGKGPASTNLPPDIATGVPDFVKDHFTAEDRNLKKNDLLNHTHLPSKGLSLENDDFGSDPLDFSSSGRESNSFGHRSKQSRVSDEEWDDEDSSASNSKGRIPAAGLQLPDFLSDGAILGGKLASCQNEVEDFSRPSSRQDDLHSQLKILQEQNKQLRVDLEKEKLKCNEKNQRISQLKSDLERQKKKELEETTVMEKAVQQVEENLATTTKRAVQAEANVSKLKQDVKTLQSQVLALTQENEAYRSGDGGLADIRERTKYSSEQLKQAATSAEKNLKDLMAGVDKLKLLSLVLSSFEKVTDVDPDQANQEDGQHQ